MVLRRGWGGLSRMNAAGRMRVHGQVRCKPDLEPAGVVEEPGGDVQHLVADGLEGGFGAVAVHAQALQPGGQCLGAQHELEPHFVALPVGGRQVGQARVLGVADAVLVAGVGGSGSVGGPRRRRRAGG